MSRCIGCGIESRLVAHELGVCGHCLRKEYSRFEEHIRTVRAEGRKRFGLPGSPPQHPDGITCELCMNRCRVAPDGVGYCGLPLGDRSKAAVSWYYDPLPTNCVADWVCPGGTGCGYPTFAYTNGPEQGYQNLAVFYHACSFDCLFCQNWHFRLPEQRRDFVSAAALAQAVTDTTACICFFGGDPTPQLPHSIRAAHLAREKAGSRILRLCWETNGTMSPSLLDDVLELALNSGGCVKFDLKAWDEGLHIALTGVTNRQTLTNFRRAAELARKRPEPPLVVASTLLVPGYVDETEVSRIAGFIADVNPDVPYRLLAFYPQFMFWDLPTTRMSHAVQCRDAAVSAGLSRVSIGNVHLLR
ncbi:MAG: radical SAM protein [Armatimonadota bacterium]